MTEASGRLIDTSTRICLILGDPVAHSLSPVVHNAAYRAAGCEREFVYAASRVRAEELPSAIMGIRALHLRGVSCTIPHKQAVIPLLDWVEENARQSGAVNTVVNDDGTLKGYNTDIEGIVAPLESLGKMKGSAAAIIGAGGAARAAVFGILSRGGKPTVFNRSKERAEELGKSAGVPWAELSNSKEIAKFNIIINATSVGMTPNTEASPLEPDQISKGQIVFDTVYTPLRTKLLRIAEERGARTIPGAEMFLAQAAAQFKLFTGREAPLEVMRSILLSHLEKRK